MKKEMEVDNKFVALKEYVHGQPSESNFEVKTGPLALTLKKGSNQIIVKNFYVSIDPYQINRIKAYSSSHKASGFSTQIGLGEVFNFTFPNCVLLFVHCVWFASSLIMCTCMDAESGCFRSWKRCSFSERGVQRG